MNYISLFLFIFLLFTLLFSSVFHYIFPFFLTSSFSIFLNSTLIPSFLIFPFSSICFYYFFTYFLFNLYITIVLCIPFLSYVPFYIYNRFSFSSSSFFYSFHLSVHSTCTSPLSLVSFLLSQLHFTSFLLFLHPSSSFLKPGRGCRRGSFPTAEISL